MEEFSYDLKIPKDRIAVLIGKEGKIKKELEEEMKIAITVDSKEGDVMITGSDAISLYTTREVIKAIARGFNPEIAHLLLKQDYAFELISLDEYAKGRKNQQLRLKGRVIGEKGKCRRTVEQLTECFLCVYGKTVAIIGVIDYVPVAKKAISMILSGSPHASVYRWLERKRRELKRAEFKSIE